VLDPAQPGGRGAVEGGGLVSPALIERSCEIAVEALDRVPERACSVLQPVGPAVGHLLERGTGSLELVGELGAVSRCCLRQAFLRNVERVEDVVFGSGADRVQTLCLVLGDGVGPVDLLPERRDPFGQCRDLGATAFDLLLALVDVIGP
jgi:hypothetical protein